MPDEDQAAAPPAGTSASAGKRRPSRRKKLLIALTLLPVWLLVGEAGVRVAHAVRGGAYHADATRQHLVDTRSFVIDKIPDLDQAARARQAADGVVLKAHPYTGWEAMDDQISRETMGYLSGRFDESFEVLIIGGSVSALTAAKGGEAICGVLRADPRLKDRNVLILNHGRGSFKQPQMTLKAAYLLTLGYRPDAIVLIDGFNEVALGYDNVTFETHPLFPHWGQYGPLIDRVGIDLDQIRRFSDALAVRDEIDAAVGFALRWHLYESAILGTWSRSRIDGMRRKWIALQTEIVKGTTGTADDGGFHPERGGAFPRNVDRVLDVITNSWVDCSIELDSLCRAYGIAYLHVLQPTLHDEGSKPLTEQEIQGGNAKQSWMEGTRLGYPRLRAASARLIEAGIVFLDGSDTFAELSETTYYDCCHFRGKGMDMFATRVAEALLAALPE